MALLARDINISSKSKNYRQTNIKDKICKYFNITLIQIDNKTRKREITQARQVGMWCEKKLTNKSYKQIGSNYGKVHATAMHAVKNVDNLIETDKYFKNQIIELSYLIPFDANKLIKNVEKVRFN
jgi:chromosomal replication initiator protein